MMYTIMRWVAIYIAMQMLMQTMKGNRPSTTSSPSSPPPPLEGASYPDINSDSASGGPRITKPRGASPPTSPNSASASASISDPAGAFASYLPESVLQQMREQAALPTFPGPGPPHRCAWAPYSPVTVDVFITYEEEFSLSLDLLLQDSGSSGSGSISIDSSSSSSPPPPLFHWTVSDGLRLFDPSSSSHSITYDVPVLPSGLAHNASLYAHCYFTRNKGSVTGGSPLTVSSYEKLYGEGSSNYFKKTMKLNRHRLRRKNKDVRNLLGDDKTAADKKKVVPSPTTTPSGRRTDDEDLSLLGNASRDHDNDVYLSYLKPTLSLQFVQIGELPRNTIPKNMLTSMDFVDQRSGSYYPVVYVNEFWMTSDSLSAINGTVDSLPLAITVEHTSMWKWQLMSSMEQQWKMQSSMGASEGESDIIRKMITDTNPILLAITIVVSLLHSVFDILAFKNDITFFKGKKSMEGLSIRTMVVNAFFQAVIFLYLVDNDTSLMILVSNGIGLAIEFWKISKAVNISFNGGKVSWVEVDSYKKSKTKEYDEIATSHLLYVTMPLMAGYAAYSLTHMKHKSWYSWILTSLVGFIYMFGFVMMTPQLFINYKLQSVAHLNWRTMTYKSLNTFVDDLFAFVIKMPIMHRLACFRDDIVFFIFLYQRWIYRVDYTRVNEYGQSALAPEQAALADAQEQATITAATTTTTTAAADLPDEGGKKRGKRDKVVVETGGGGFAAGKQVETN